jgi:hypothetical protein
LTLPGLEWQWVYARLAWGVVLAALLLRAWPHGAGPTPRAAWVAAALALAAMWLPHAASPAYWLGLVFQYPSAMLVACCAVPWLWRRAAPRADAHPPVPAAFPAVMALGGLVLYADSVGALHLDLYARGFDRLGAPAVALAAAAWAVWALRRPACRVPALIVLSCALLFCLTRLPTGNVFDAFLDPLIWLWSVVASLRAVRWRRSSRVRA